MPEPLDPRTEERVRRLLADARHREPMPAEVAERLEAVLADLAAEPEAQQRVVDLHRRRRRASALLVAAAAVVAVGLGGKALLDRSGSDADAGAAADRSVLSQRPEAAAPESSGAGDFGVTREQLSERRAKRVRPDRFAADVERLQAYAVSGSALSAEKQDLRADSTTSPHAGIACHRHGWGSGRTVPVRYGRSPGVLVFRKPTGDTQVVDLFLCGGRDVVRTVTLPRP